MTNLPYQKYMEVLAEVGYKNITNLPISLGVDLMIPTDHFYIQTIMLLIIIQMYIIPGLGKSWCSSATG
ncbi:hypothetical protein CS542_08360 [Pedobacter sp. IW39]|nr:hypothetical protein CS542_08360 [Pedobacter sp. IW39]